MIEESKEVWTILSTTRCRIPEESFLSQLIG